MIEFDSASHTYRLNGVVVPSVTQALSLLSNFSHVDADVLARAQAFGTAAHFACELHDKDDLDEEGLDPALAPCVTAWKMFRAISDFVPVHTEARVWSDNYQYAGTLDRIGTIQGKLVLIDIKTGTTLPKTIGPQLAAYEQAARERGLIEKRDKILRYAVQLKTDGSYRIEPYTHPGDLSAFLACIQIHNWRKNNGN